MVRTKICVYRNCRSDSRYSYKDHMKGVWFIPFPKRGRMLNTCTRWINWLGRDDYPIERVSGDTYLCSKHFVGGKGPTIEFPDPIHSQQDLVSILRPRLDIPDTSVTPEKNLFVQTNLTKDTNESEDQFLAIPEIPDIPQRVFKNEIPDDVISQITPDIVFHPLPCLKIDSEIFEDELSGQNDEPEENCVNEPTLMDFKTTFENFKIPLGWSVTVLEDCLKFRKIMEENGHVLYGITIKSNYETEYYVNGKIVNNEISKQKFPQQITLCTELDTVIRKLTDTKQCVGNADEKYVKIFKARREPLGFQGVNGEIRSNRCTLIMDEKYTKRTRCFFCLKQRESFRCTVKRKRKKGAVQFKNLSRDELILRLKEKGSSITKLKGKIHRQEEQIKKDRNWKKKMINSF